MLYSIAFTTKYQHESAIGLQMSPSTWTSLLPTLSPFHLSRQLLSTGLSSPVIQLIPIGYLFYTWQCMFPWYTLHTSPLPKPCPQVCAQRLCLHCCSADRFRSAVSLDSIICVQFRSVPFSCAVVSDSLRPHEVQHARPPYPSSTPGVHPNPHPLSQWCHPAISSSVVPFSSCLQSFPASGSFLMSQLFTSGGQSIGASTSASVLPWIFRIDFI